MNSDVANRRMRVVYLILASFELTHPCLECRVQAPQCNLKSIIPMQHCMHSKLTGRGVSTSLLQYACSSISETSPDSLKVS